MNEQSEALGFAICLESRGYQAEAEELRRLHAENERLRAALKQPQGDQEPMRKMYVCNSCQFPYADQPPSQCDCLGGETYTEAYLFTNQQPQREPLTDERINALIDEHTVAEGPSESLWHDCVILSRAVERAHGIK